MGTLLVDAYVNKNITTPCGGLGRFAGFQMGQIITVTDNSGSVVAQSSLGQCRWTHQQGCMSCPGIPDFDRAKPEFAFTVSAVPESPTYVVRVDWKTWSVSLAELTASNWRLDLGVR